MIYYYKDFLTFSAFNYLTFLFINYSPITDDQLRKNKHISNDENIQYLDWFTF